MEMIRTVTRERRTEGLPIYAAAESTQKQQPRKGGDEGEEGGKDGPQKLAKKGQELKEDMDALLYVMDDVLYENAEEFVNNYVQRGGE